MADFKNSLSLNGTSVSVVGHNHQTTDLTDLADSGLQLRHGFPLPYAVSLSYSPITRQITLTPSGVSFIIWIKGIKFTKTGSQTSPAHNNTTGNYFFYYDAAGVLQVSSTPWEINSLNSPVCYVYYNNNLIDAIALFELHTADRSLEWHESQHFLTGTFLRSGLEISGYTLNTNTAAAVTFGLASGIIVDEDIEYVINSLADNGPYFILNREGSSDFTWTTANVLPYRYGTTYIQYNQNITGTWQLTQLASTNYVNYYVFATTALDSAKRIFLVPGQAVFTSLTLAQGENVGSLNWGSFAITEMTALWKLTFQARNNYTGVSGQARLIEVTKITVSKAQLTGSFVLGAHNSLSQRDVFDSHPSSAITNTPAGNIVAIDVQAAINELDSEKQPLLISGTSLKTINSISLLGSGNILITGGGLVVTSVKTSAYSANDNEFVRINSASGSFEIYLPIDPLDGAMVSIADITGDCGTNPVLITGGTKTILNDVSGVSLDVSYGLLELLYNDATSNWCNIGAIGGGSGTGGLYVTPVKTSNYSGGNNELIRLNSFGGSFIISLPANPQDGSLITVSDVTGFCFNNPVLINGGTKTVLNDSLGVSLDIAFGIVELLYNDATSNWCNINNQTIINTSQTIWNKTFAFMGV